MNTREYFIAMLYRLTRINVDDAPVIKSHLTIPFQSLTVGRKAGYAGATVHLVCKQVYSSMPSDKFMSVAGRHKSIFPKRQKEIIIGSP
uniref:Transposase n=1 Tax=Panagrellus redivivus TaxID=6233 RepID=A0A7E4W6V2_PANRE